MHGRLKLNSLDIRLSLSILETMQKNRVSHGHLVPYQGNMGLFCRPGLLSNEILYSRCTVDLPMLELLFFKAMQSSLHGATSPSWALP